MESSMHGIMIKPSVHMHALSFPSNMFQISPFCRFLFFLQRLTVTPFPASQNNMRSFLTINSIIAVAYVAVNLVAAAPNVVKLPRNIARDVTPQLPFDPNTTKYCTAWWDTEGDFTCLEIVDAWGIALADFIRWVCLFILSVVVSLSYIANRHSAY
jgi:hypothetical protein